MNQHLKRWHRNGWTEITVPLENYIGERVAVVYYNGSGETWHSTGTVERSYDSRTGEPGVSIVSSFPRDISGGEASSTDLHAILTKREAS